MKIIYLILIFKKLLNAIKQLQIKEIQIQYLIQANCMKVVKEHNRIINKPFNAIKKLRIKDIQSQFIVQEFYMKKEKELNKI